MNIFDYLNKRHILQNMTDNEFEEFLPNFTNALVDYGFDNLIIYYNNSLKNIHDDWTELCNRTINTNNISSTNTVGLSILKQYMTHIYHVKNYKGKNIANYWTSPTITKAIRVNRKSHSTPYISELVRQIGFVSGTSKVTMYRPLLTKRIVEYFQAKSVLDVCVGWGGRMLGSACIKDVHYTGIEPCKQTFEKLQQICSDLSITNVNLINDCAENAITKLPNKYDLAITSPPYYNLEIYSDEPTQSHHYGSYEQWIESFLKPVVFGVLDNLKETGKSAWSVKNIKTDKKYNLYNDIERLHNERGWKKMDVDFYVGNSIRPGSNKDKDGNIKIGQEFTYIFTK